METTAKITKSLRKEDVQRNWLVVDVAGKTIGRVATQIALILKGKNKPSYTPHVDNGDFVIVINASQLKLEGKRAEQKEYYHNTGYPGAARFEAFRNVMISKPQFALEHAVKGMLPKNRLGRQMIKKLKVYAGAEHPHTAQKPALYELPY